ncbi:hypothetical protein AVEN_65635-1 [Araneus ventricosus]|uniref:Uncharacterized protein n=1 Tax=Araneus ventricosus TaxID=182803 RepID=A0A4Y2IZF3_ARAVE|nr:hypothetical protein AVEN_65635-1 [Araneus ventricosus]
MRARFQLANYVGLVSCDLIQQRSQIPAFPSNQTRVNLRALPAVNRFVSCHLLVPSLPKDFNVAHCASSHRSHGSHSPNTYHTSSFAMLRFSITLKEPIFFIRYRSHTPLAVLTLHFPTSLPYSSPRCLVGHCLILRFVADLHSTTYAILNIQHIPDDAFRVARCRWTSSAGTRRMMFRTLFVFITEQLQFVFFRCWTDLKHLN